MVAQVDMQAQSSAEFGDMIAFKQTMAQGLEYPDAGFGYKFPLPDVSTIARTDHLKRRYDTVLDQVTKSLMQHGKLSVAQKVRVIPETL